MKIMTLFYIYVVVALAIITGFPYGRALKGEADNDAILEAGFTGIMVGVLWPIMLILVVLWLPAFITRAVIKRKN